MDHIISAFLSFGSRAEALSAWLGLVAATFSSGDNSLAAFQYTGRWRDVGRCFTTEVSLEHGPTLRVLGMTY